LPLAAATVFFEILILACLPNKYLKRTLILIIKLLSMGEVLFGLDFIVSEERLFFLWRRGRFIWLRNSIVLIIMGHFASVIMSLMYKRCLELALILPHEGLQIIYKPLLYVVFGIFRTARV
jgi:hypothetical protein